MFGKGRMLGRLKQELKDQVMQGWKEGRAGQLVNLFQKILWQLDCVSERLTDIFWALIKKLRQLKSKQISAIMRLKTNRLETNAMLPKNLHQTP